MPIQDLKDLYEVTKTVRFNLLPVQIKINKNNNSEPNKDVLGDFVKNYKKLTEDLKRVFFRIEKNEKEKIEINNEELNSAFQTRKNWLRQYCKREFYDNNLYSLFEKQKSWVSFVKFGFLLEKFNNWVDRNLEHISCLERITNPPKHQQERVSDIAYYLHQINTRSNFEFVYELVVNNLKNKNEDQAVINLQDLVEKIKNQLAVLEEIYLPSQSMGRIIEKSSLNYYTVNKKSKDYDKDIEEKIVNLEKAVSEITYFDKSVGVEKPKFSINKKIWNDVGFLDHIKSVEDENFVEQVFNGSKKVIKNVGTLKMQALYKLMKAFKANKKSEFYELLKQNKADDKIFDDIKSLTPLFNCERENFDKINKLTGEIKRLSDEKNNLDKNYVLAQEKQKIIDRIKEQRGKHFDVQNQYCSFRAYKEFCEEFKRVSIEYGVIKGKVKALKKEKIDAERLKSWAVILEKEGQKYLLTIPRTGEDNLRKTYQLVSNLSNSEQNSWVLFAFESLTLRALEKLCFGFDKENELGGENKYQEKQINTFIREISLELEKVSPKFFEKGKLKRKDSIGVSESELVCFYMAVLRLNSARKMLKISNSNEFDKMLAQSYESPDEFGIELEKVCYVKKQIFISEEIKDQLIGDFQGDLYKISSYDLEKEDPEVLSKLEGKKFLERKSFEMHTKYWVDFWTKENEENQHDIKINPEVSISFVRENKAVIQNRSLGDLKKNRRLKDKYLLSATISLNSNSKTTNLAFCETKDVIEHIKTFNEDLNSKVNPYNTYYFGLDRGQKELLTLGIFKFEDKDEKAILSDGKEIVYKKPNPIEIEYYEISEKELKLEKNDEKGIKRMAYKNLSYFPELLKKEDKKTKVCLDLSCAKLIQGKIVINGDVSTYLNLKMYSAKRKIYEGIVNKQFRTENVCFNSDKSCFFLNIENGGQFENKNLYFYDEKYKDVLPFDVAEKELQDYYDGIKKMYTGQQGVDNSELDDNEIVSIEKVNNLRDAICANAVGILNFLFQKYNGFFVFEDLPIEGKISKNAHLRQFSGNLASRIEFKLLQKFQSHCLVPQNYKQVMTLQSEKRIEQLGVIIYIKTSGTSSGCPICETKNEDKNKKWLNHSFVCKNENCRFETFKPEKRRGLDFCDNSDSVAAYNIAKRGLEFITKQTEK